MSSRYSDEAMAKKRVANRERFLKKSKAKFGERFNFPYLKEEYETQKTSKVTIGCPDHPGAKMAPDKHLQSNTGCRDCGIEERGKKRFERGRKVFLERFKKKFSGKAELVSEYKGGKKSVKAKCFAEGHIFPVSAGHLKDSFDYGCPVCYRPLLTLSQMMPEEDFIKRVQKRFPEIDFSISKYKGSSKLISFICPEHGKQRVANAGHLNKSFYGCPACAKANIGYAGYRIRQLNSGDPTIKSRPTRIALMKMEIFGFVTYKIGTTYRRLETRYKENLVKVYFEAKLVEIDALKLENLLLVKYRNDRDLRIEKKGREIGKRWSGDRELFLKRALKPMLSEIKSLVQELSENDPNYWGRFKGLELPFDKPRDVVFKGGVYNEPRPVICLDDKTVYGSGTEAALKYNTVQSSVSAVCLGKRGSTNGKRFAYLEDFENDRIPIFKPLKGTRRSVRCIDTGEVFTSITDAGKEKGFNPCHLGEVCLGKRNLAGGFRWEYV